MPDELQILPNRPQTIVILAVADVQLLDVAGPLQVFSAANEYVRSRGADEPYRTSVVSPAPGNVRSSAGLQLVADPIPNPDEPIDTLIVAGGQGVMQAAENEALVGWVAGRAGHVRRMAAVCTGAFILAAANLLNGRRAVTHWDYCDRLAAKYPAVDVDPDPIFIRDDSIWTSAGITAGIDLALALVEDDLGREVALAVSRQLVVFLKRPGGQAQFSATLSLQSTDDRFAKLHEWMRDNLSADLSVHRLAVQAGMSDRTFARRYTEVTGRTPARAIERLRTEYARQLLSETRLPIKRIAARCGFGSEETMRRAFQRLQSVTPQEYRDRFST